MSSGEEAAVGRVVREVLSTIAAPCVVIDCVNEKAVGHGYPSSAFKRTIRGSKMTSFQGLMDEFGAALQFFDGFGENWYALRDCLRSLDEWLPADAYVLEVTHPQSLLENAPEELLWFLKVMEEVYNWWSVPIVNNGLYNRPAVPFHVVLQASEAECEATQRRFPGVPVLLPTEVLPEGQSALNDEGPK